jgi:hypothetical protein
VIVFVGLKTPFCVVGFKTKLLQLLQNAPIDWNAVVPHDDS